MSESGSEVFEAQFRLDDAEINSVRRKIAQSHLPYAISAMALSAIFAAFLVYLSGRGWVEVFVDDTEFTTAAIWTGLALWLLYMLWTSGKVVGIVSAHARRPDTAICKGLVDGVDVGDCTARLTEDAIYWEMRDFEYALNLKGIKSATHSGTMIFVRNNTSEYRFSFPPNCADWVKSINARKRAGTLAEWTLPEGPDWRAYSLTRDAYIGGLSETEQQATPPGSLIGAGIGMLGHLVILWFCLTVLAAETYDWRTAVVLVILALSLYTAKREGWSFLQGLKRRKGGMTGYGRDVADVTHGATVFRICEDGIEIRRPLLRKTIRWNAIGSVVQNDGWLALRACETTLDVLPSTVDLVQALSDIGFDVPSGPWERTKGTRVLEKAA